MEDRTIRPSMKSVHAGYVLVLLGAFAADWALYTYTEARPWALAIPFALLLFPLKAQVARRMNTLRLHDGHLTFEAGFLSSTRRTVDMTKIQDVTVRQSLGQRLMGTGDIMLETAGESGRMEILSVDAPRRLADEIIASAKRI